MKLAVNTRLLLPGRLEGVGWFTHEVLQRLVGRHPDWEFLFLFDRPWDAGFVFGPQVRPLLVPPPARHPALWLAWFQVALPLVFKREKPDVFFSADGHCSLFTSVPTLMVVHDIAHDHFPEQVPFWARQYYDQLVPRFLRRADTLLTVSDFSRQDIHRQHPNLNRSIGVCGNGARPGFHPLSESEKQAVRGQYAGGRDYFFYLGSVNPRKNVPRLLRAFDRFKEKTGAPVLLLLGGRFGWLTGEVKDAFEQCRYRHDIRFLDYVPESELPRLLGAALALTYVSLFEGFGLPVLEAFEAETPVISSRSSSLPEVAGEAALLVDPYDEQAIAAALELVFLEPDLREKLISAGRIQRLLFSWEKTTDIVEQALMDTQAAKLKMKAQ